MTLSACSKLRESHLATKPIACSLDELRKLDLGSTAIWGTSSRVDTVLKHLDGVCIDLLEEARNSFDTLIVVGGGMRIDAAKMWRAERRPDLRLVAIPSVWGIPHTDGIATSRRSGRRSARHIFAASIRIPPPTTINVSKEFRASSSRSIQTPSRCFNTVSTRLDVPQMAVEPRSSFRSSSRLQAIGLVAK